MRIIFVPTRWESQAALRSLPDALPQPKWDVPAWRAGDLLVLEPGMGPRLSGAMLPLLDSLMPREVWLYGWCGGLVPELRVGDLVLADATILAEGDDALRRISHSPSEAVLAQTRSLAERLDRPLIVGPALTSDHVLVSVEQKQAGAASGAVAVEMEAGPLARWSVTRSVPFVHLRVVLDPLGSPLPPTPLPADDHGYISRHALFLHVMSHPGEWRSLWDLMQQMRRARRVMADVMAMLTDPGGPLAPGNAEGH